MPKIEKASFRVGRRQYAPDLRLRQLPIARARMALDALSRQQRELQLEVVKSKPASSGLEFPHQAHSATMRNGLAHFFFIMTGRHDQSARQAPLGSDYAHWARLHSFPERFGGG